MSVDLQVYFAIEDEGLDFFSISIEIFRFIDVEFFRGWGYSRHGVSSFGVKFCFNGCLVTGFFLGFVRVY